MIAIDPIREQSLSAPYSSAEPALPVKGTPRTLSPAQKLQRQAYSKQETKNRLGLIGTVLVCAGISLFLVSRYAAMMVDNYGLQELRTTLSRQLDNTDALRAEVYQLSSPTRILGIATGVLKMEPTTPVAVGTSGH